jgi:hypothetical protein
MAKKKLVKLDSFDPDELITFCDGNYWLSMELKWSNDERTVTKRLHACKYDNELMLDLEGILTPKIARVRAFSGLTNVEALSVNGNELLELPDFLRKFTGLKYLVSIPKVDNFRASGANRGETMPKSS